jgi:hypothetical protein
MKPIAQLILLPLLLAACAIPPANIPAPRTATPSATASPTLELAPFDIAQDEPETPIPDIPTITPLPTIPTFTPTFDVRAIFTATPAPRPKCPQPVPLDDPDLDFLDISIDNTENRINLEQNILNFLNQYGANSFYEIIKTKWRLENIIFLDLTNNGEPELALEALYFFIFGCKNGEYVTLFQLYPDAYLRAPSIVYLDDNNQNGIPELTMLLGFMSQGGHAFGVYEWDGEVFTSLIPPPYPEYPDYRSIWVEATGKIDYEDINQNSVKELVVNSGVPIWSVYHDGLPWRNKRTIYFWNGQQYGPGHREFEPPEFRFQAIQDGDLALSQQEYAKAIELYQQAIFDAELKAYSPEIRQNLQDAWTARIGPDKTPTPTPVPPDPTEYPRLAAYAYYRMVILHTFLGEMDSAQVKYATLQEKFPAGSPGHPYVEMATGFWNAWQSSGRMYDACAAAIAFANAHPEILVPLGSDYHGWQSHRYQPADVCPFR